MGNGFLDDLFKGIAVFILVCAVGLAVVAGGGAVGGYMLAASLGAGKAMALAAAGMSALAAPLAAAGAWMGVSKWNKHRREEERKARYASYTVAPPAQAVSPAPPKPAAQPTVTAPADDTPPVFVDALAKMKEMSTDDRKKYLDRLRDAFPNEVETLHKYNDDMALAHDAPMMKKLTLIKPSNSGNTP